MHVRHGYRHTCLSCASDEYQPHPGRDACVKCDTTCPQGEQHTGCGGSSPGRCEACAAGRHKAQQGTGNCLACTTGRYHAATGQANCRDCWPGRYQTTAGQTQCDECNYHCNAGEEHSGCGVPPFNTLGKCNACPAGQFKRTAGTDACTACGSGTFQDTTGAMSCKLCPDGQFQDEGGMSACKTCASLASTCLAGQAHTSCGGANPGSCSACAAGRFKAAPGQGQCLDCDPGTVSDGIGAVAGTGAEMCRPCLPGMQWQDGTGARNCKPITLCNNDQYEVAKPTASSDRVCRSHSQCMTGLQWENVVGIDLQTQDRECHTYTVCDDATEYESTFATATSDRLCLPLTTCGDEQWETKAAGAHHDRECAEWTVCTTQEWQSVAPGTHNDRECRPQTACPKGYRELLAPTSSSNRVCVPCGAGRFSAFVGNNAQCEACAPGQHQPRDGRDACLPCAIGTVQDEGAQATCKDCTAGQFQARHGQELCEDCASGTYQDSTRAGSCKLCDMRCPAGSEHTGCHGDAGTCNACPAGTYKPADSSAQCMACPAGQIAPNAGASQCTPCPSGTYQEQTKATSCVNCNYHCEAGEQHTGCAGASPGTCEKCAAGHHKAAPGSLMCAQCAPGRFHELAGQSSCKDCDVGRFQPLGGQSACTACDTSCEAGRMHEGCGGAFAGTCVAPPGRCGGGLAGWGAWRGRRSDGVGTACSSL